MEKAVLYKLEIAFLKIIPMVLAGCFLANTILSYFAIETEVLSYIAGIGILDYINSIVHEAEHIKQAMLKAYNINESGEPPANTVAYLVEKMLQVFII